MPIRKPAIGLTLIEVMVAIAILATLAGILLPAILHVRKRATIAATAQALRELDQAIATYRAADGQHRFPPPQSDLALSLRPPTAGSSAILALLEAQGLPLSSALRDDEGRLIDAWGQPIRYRLDRPSVSDPASLETWNWDADLGRERAWGRRWDGAAISSGALPFAYLYSLGPTGNAGRAADWIFIEDHP